MLFSTISKIQADRPETWRDKIFLGFDIDWACDELFEETVSLLERTGTPSTWFATHSSPLIKRLCESPLFEVGIHPNFNDLLSGAVAKSHSAAGRIEELRAEFPAAVSARSHSMTQSSRILDIFKENGFAYDCNTFIPARKGLAAAPFSHWNGITKVPFRWEDDIWCIEGASEGAFREAISAEGVKTFSFHPIHVFLNTSKLSAYESAKRHYHDPEALRSLRQGGFGTKDFLEKIISEHGR